MTGTRSPVVVSIWSTSRLLIAVRASVDLIIVSRLPELTRTLVVARHALNEMTRDPSASELTQTIGDRTHTVSNSILVLCIVVVGF